MAEVSSINIQEHFVPHTVREGSSEKRISEVYIDCTSASVADTLDLSDYMDLNSILGISMEVVDGATASTANTFSGTTITFAGHSGSGVWDLKVTIDH